MGFNWRSLHVLLAVGWGVTALVMATAIAALGGEEARLERQRGEDRQARLDLSVRRDQLLSEVDRASTPTRLDHARRELQLNISPPLQLAALGRLADPE